MVMVRTDIGRKIRGSKQPEGRNEREKIERPPPSEENGASKRLHDMDYRRAYEQSPAWESIVSDVDAASR